VHIKFWTGNLKEGGKLRDLILEEMIILKSTADKWDVSMWTELKGFRICINGALLLNTLM